MTMALEVTLIIVLVFMVLLVAGAPIAFAILFSSIVALFFVMPADVALLVSTQSIANGVDKLSLLAIPFFILAGSIMNNGGIAIRLINLAKVLSGRMPGALIQTNVVGNLLFGSISGSAVASAAAMGSILSPLQKKEGYDPAEAAAVNIASAPVGLLIPPSNILITYSLVSGGTSVAALFLAGYLPGFLWGGFCMLVALIIAKRNKYPVSERVPLKTILVVFLKALPSLFIILVVIGGITAGIFTATEGAGVAVLYTFVLATVFYRTLKVKDIPALLLETVRTTSVIMFLIAASSVMSYVLTRAGVPQLISSSILDVTENKIVILLIVNLILLLVGTVIDMTPAVLIFTPILLPIVTELGMSSVHFGIMMVMNLCIGSITPPVGTILFVGCRVGATSVEKVFKPLIPYYLVILLALFMVTYIPGISMWLPTVLGK